VLPRCAPDLAERNQQHGEERVRRRIDDEEDSERVRAERQDRPGQKAPDPEAEVDRAIAHAEHVLAPPILDGVDEQREHPDPHHAEPGSLEAGRHDRRAQAVDREEPDRPGTCEHQAGDGRPAGAEAVGRHPGRDRAHEAGRARDGECEPGRGEADSAAVVQEDDHDRKRHPRADLEEQDAPEEPPRAGAERREETPEAVPQGA